MVGWSVQIYSVRCDIGPLTVVERLNRGRKALRNVQEHLPVRRTQMCDDTIVLSLSHTHTHSHTYACPFRSSRAQYNNMCVHKTRTIIRVVHRLLSSFIFFFSTLRAKSSKVFVHKNALWLIRPWCAVLLIYSLNI